MNADLALGRVVLLLVMCAGLGWLGMGVAVQHEWQKERSVVAALR